MSGPTQNPSYARKEDFLKAGSSLLIAVTMLLVGISTGQMVFVFMAGAMVLIGGGEALRHRGRGPSLFLVRIGRLCMLASLAYVVFLIFGVGDV